MKLLVTNQKGEVIIINLYAELAPNTVQALGAVLPFEREIFHARLSGQEIWCDDMPQLDVPQENASVHAQPGEFVVGPKNPIRNQITGCLGLFYGKGTLIDCGNIIGKVEKDDLSILKSWGQDIWQNGSQILSFSRLEE